MIFKMSLRKESILSLAAVLAVAGCTVIRDAREAQREFEACGRDDFVRTDSGRLDLSAFSLSQFVDFAMTNRPSVASAALAVEDARLALKALRADAPVVSSTPWLAPSLSLSGGYSAASDSASIEDLRAKTHGSATAALALSLPLYDFGRHDAKLAAQCEQVLAAELNLVDVGYEVFYEVCNAYFTLLERGALFEVAQTNEFEYALHLEQAEKRMKAGDARELDVTRARLDLAKAREDTVTAKSDVDTAGADFLKALGVDASYGTRIEVVDFPGNALTFAMRGFPETGCSVNEAFELAQTNAPSMRLARAKLRAASADVDYAVADLLPELTASASLSWTDPLWVWNWGVSGVQSLFQGFRKTTAVERAVVALKQSAAAVEEEELALSQSLETAIAVRDTSRKARETAAASLKSAAENLQVVRKQYLVGDVGRVEYTDAVADYVDAMGSRISAFYKGQRAECAIFSLIGIYPVYEEKKLTEELK